MYDVHWSQNSWWIVESISCLRPSVIFWMSLIKDLLIFRSSNVNVVTGFLCKDIVSLKQQVLSRYPKFIRKLLESTSKEVQFLSRIVLEDQRSNTCGNISYLSEITKINNVIMVAGWRIRQALKQKCTLEPWRRNLLETFMKIKYDKTHEENQAQEIKNLQSEILFIQNNSKRKRQHNI